MKINSEGLRFKAVSSVSWTTLGAVVMVIIHIVQVAILSKILSAREFGLMSLVLVVINFSNIFVDIGISKAIIHKQDVPPKHLSSLYYSNILLGILLFTIIWFSAPFISSFFNDKDLVKLLKTISIVFLIQPLGQQFTALLQKELQFKSIAIRNIIARFTSLIIAVILAYKGYGVYSLVFSQITYVVVGTILIIVIGLRIHRPSFHFNFSDLKGYMHFGLFQMGDQLVTYFNSQMDVIIIGKLLGTSDVGIYSIAKDLINKPMFLINPIITKVTFPLLAKLQDDINKAKKAYLRIVNLVSSVNFPVYAVMILLAEPIILLILGDKWTSSIKIFQILGFVYLLRSRGNPSGSFMQALGRPDISFSWNLSMFFIIPVFFYIGSFGGLKGVAISFLMFQVLGIFPYWYFVFYKATKMTFIENLNSFVYPLVFSMVLMICCYPIIYFMDNFIIKILIVLCLFLIVYILLTIKFNSEFMDEFKRIVDFLPIKIKKVILKLISKVEN